MKLKTGKLISRLKIQMVIQSKTHHKVLHYTEQVNINHSFSRELWNQYLTPPENQDKV